MIHLEKVSSKTFDQVVNMKLSPEQAGFVAPNVVSMAQAWLYYDTGLPLAICDGEMVVGFAWLTWVREGNRAIRISRLMIASEHQRKGYGKKALEALIAMVREMNRETDRFDLIGLGFHPDNAAAQRLYQALGFHKNGKLVHGEVQMVYPLTDSPKVGKFLADKDDLERLAHILQQEADSPLKPELLPALVEKGQITCFSIMGEIIGFAAGDVLVMDHQHKPPIKEAR